GPQLHRSAADHSAAGAALLRALQRSGKLEMGEGARLGGRSRGAPADRRGHRALSRAGKAARGGPAERPALLGRERPAREPASRTLGQRLSCAYRAARSVALVASPDMLNTQSDVPPTGLSSSGVNVGHVASSAPPPPATTATY